MNKQIETQNAPKPIGPYSQAIAFGNMVWVSGCIALNPHSGAMADESLAAETHQVLKNLKAIVEASGSSMSKIVKTTIYLTDMGSFTAVNEIYGQYFKSPFPARETVEIVALPKGARVEISCVASL
jgi:2-iminobutanoate/2-iminopropanoate deaminase